MRIDGRYLWKASPNELLDQPFRRGQELKNLRTFWLIVLNVIFDGDNAQRAALGTADLRKPPMKLRAAIVHHDHRAAAAGEEIGDHADRLRIGIVRHVGVEGLCPIERLYANPCIEQCLDEPRLTHARQADQPDDTPRLIKNRAHPFDARRDR